ncbi:MAG: hypothetical protein M1823_004372 [Watsoniomyces obsoletus]|nr:MAG: hypothetical protein M1823_004372 [Watsoniomyces obsoletus]
MPHSVPEGSEQRSSVPNGPGFAKTTLGGSPLVAGETPYHHAGPGANLLDGSRKPGAGALASHQMPNDRWLPRNDTYPYRSTYDAHGSTTRHGRQKSLSEAFKTIKERRGSVSANAHELADALKAPVSPRLIVFCLIWYLTSALTNTSSKSIMNAFPRPVTLTLVQFAFVSSWCLLLARLASVYPSLRSAIPALKHGIRPPSREVLMTTLPLAIFQVGGHLLSSTATSRIPVSLVHTIKGLSPLFTVFAYRIFFRIHYALSTYLSLIPLTLGVMLACSAEFSDNLFGILCAFGGAIIFVSQNIFSKRLFNEAARAEAEEQTAPLLTQSRKLDKLNLLCYSSGLAFALTAPLWLWSEGFMLLGDFFHDGALDLSGKKDALGAGRLTLEFLFNGTFHFGQNIMAFVLLSMVSPVTYSVASLIKRIFVISVAVVWFGSHTTRVQGVGILLTFIGLYLYDRTSDAAKADRRVRVHQSKTQAPLLPLAEFPPTLSGHHHLTQSPVSATSGQLYGRSNGFVNGLGSINGVGSDEKLGGQTFGRPRGGSSAMGRRPSPTAEEVEWRPPDDHHHQHHHPPPVSVS